ncbi:branched-chain amino acid ABC transporter permease [Marichromatium gracile]|uniref:Branched-chain amino acid ABC transporter permease n=2 Tax=Marichromatium TaxID=85076 RepID=W0E4K8_MARPU|nr:MULTISPECIES: branched-chain amino acid ABC transporter permease [Marichromatium]AHF04149.1 branched-chain amino acid ABC transporter permease [Marichromatium purpuratum 984]KXX66406.1 branched-chain amino acid ABC transporter permease [Marichromatium gracile]MCF1183321.1 branched-chain amino acid ABC transporter permease [Marichromatium gracile]RNE89806.1 branched-chain amino acid ABC transporter permease [Marichromatium sp. AB32]RNE90113.1 branched-chain amino acid ABC transporter permeas
MFYRQSGIHHTRYAATRKLWPLAADRRLLGGLLALALLAPLLLPELYLNSYLAPWLIWTAAALSLTLLMGIAGQLHFGFAAVMAIGAYTSIHLARAGVPFELALVGAGLAAALIGCVFGAAALRVKGLYLVMATLAMQYLVSWVIINVPAISGGAQATLATPEVRLLFIPLDGDTALYYTALGWTLICTLLLLNIKRSSVGRALVAVRDKDFAAAVIGVDPLRYKLLAFFTSSFLGGVSGAILAFCYYQAVTPEQFGFNVSIQLVAMVLVGGLGSVIGAYLGAGFILLLPIVLTNLLAWVAGLELFPVSFNLIAHIPLMVYGALIIAVILFEPLGLAKIYDNIRKYFLVWPFRHAQR